MSMNELWRDLMRANIAATLALYGIEEPPGGNITPQRVTDVLKDLARTMKARPGEHPVSVGRIVLPNGWE